MYLVREELWRKGSREMGCGSARLLLCVVQWGRLAYACGGYRHSYANSLCGKIQQLVDFLAPPSFLLSLNALSICDIDC